MPSPSEPSSPSTPEVRSAGRRRRAVATIAAVVVWLFGVTLGFAALQRHETTPGERPAASSRWPSTSALRAGVGRWTLVLFAHPMCPCTRATVSELEELSARHPGRMETVVLFVRPPGVPAGWERTDLWERVAKIPAVTVRADEAGAEAIAFGAKTSGSAFLYDDGGALRFAGGITAARGQAGDNVGRQAIQALVSGGTTERTSTPVFGCPLLDSPCEAQEDSCRR
jgi:hypothetical protein